MGTSWTIFRNTDAGAPALSGQAGALTAILDQVLAIGHVYGFNGNTLAYTDNSAQARLKSGGTPFTFFAQPVIGDITYFRMQAKFSKLIVNLGTAGIGGSVAWEYWNGSAWMALSTSDGTAGLTASGTVSWAPPSDWATTAVNGTTGYWVRVRCTGAPSTNPLCQNATYLGWLQAFTGTNQRAYQQAPKGGFGQLYVNVNDNAPVTAQEARIRGWETMTALDTGMNGAPTVAQAGNGLFVRKSATADAVARTWAVAADGRTFILFALTNDVAGRYYSIYAGDFFSYVSADQWGFIVIARTTENSGTNNVEWLMGLTLTSNTNTLGNSVSGGHYLIRDYLGNAGAFIPGKHVDMAKAGVSSNASAAIGNGNATPLPNGADGRAWIGPLWVHEPSSQVVRGYLRGVWAPYCQQSSFIDQDTIAGQDALASRSFVVFKTMESMNGTNNGSGATCAIVEVSDTLDTN